MLRINQLFLLIVSLVIVSLVLLTSCSSGSGSPIASPTEINQTGNMPVGQPQVGVSERFPDGTPASGMGALGIFSLSVNADEISAELTPLRQNSLTDVLEVVDITNFLRMAPCTDCAKIGSISIDADGNLVVSIGIKHPFPAGDMLKPISGKNRGDLHVFNVEGTVVSDTAGTSFPGLGNATAGFALVNADGYTPYLDSVLNDIYPTDATIHPYILHFDDYTAGNFDASNPMGFDSVTDPPPSGNLVMAMGCDYDYQDYVFDIDGTFDFIYAVGCTYAVSSASKNERFTPEYRVPQHNKKAASEVSVEIITNNLAEGDIASTADIEIHVVDINHAVAVGTNLNEMFADSSIGGITIEIPGVETSPVIVDISSPTGTGHDPSDPLVYAATITNTASGVEGTYAGLVKVLDTYSTGLNESPLLGGMDGIKRVDPTENPLAGLFDISEFATYQTFSIYVATGNELPVAILIPDPDPANITQFQTVDFDGSTSYDTDGTIELYEFMWDWDGDPLNFVANYSDPINAQVTSPSYNEVKVYTTGLRVTDDLGSVGYDSVTVDVAEINAIFVDDSNTTGVEDGTADHPYNTIQEGLTAAVSGDEVWVDDSGNNYAGPITLVADVTLLSTNWDDSDGDEQADIHSTGSTPVVTGADGATIDGFKIYGGSRYGIRVNGVDTTIRNCWVTEIIGNSAHGISIENSSSSLVEKCEISTVRSNGNYATVIGLKVSGCAPSGSDHVVIRQNNIHDVYSEGGVFGGSYTAVYGVNISGSSEAEFTNNIVNYVAGGNYNNVYGIHISSSDDFQFTNNVIYNAHKNYYYGRAYGLVISSCANFDGRNNIINRIRRSGGFQQAYGVSGPADATWEYNDVYDVSTSLYNGGISPGTGCISANPMFVSPGSDFHLQGGSPCINTGDPAISDPDSSRSDMGCYGGPDGNW